MPWMESDVHTQRVKFCLEHESGAWSMSDLCAEFQVSRKTGYKWVRRFKEGGLEALQDESRAPSTHPNRTAEEVERAILELRRKRPNWGSKKILSVLAREHPEMDLPSARSTCDAMLKRAGLVKARRPRRRASPMQPGSLTEATAPNDVWCTDHKGWFRLRNGERCEPLTITDLWSRYALCCKAASSTCLGDAKHGFREVFREFGMPKVIRSDNGTPFSSTAVAGLSQLNVWWLKLGIRSERIQPGKPQQNGQHERFHLTLQQETASPPKASRAAQQRAFDRFLKDYNGHRPHEALDMRMPAELFRPSMRPYPETEPEDFEYPGLDSCRVQHNGGIQRSGKRIFLGLPLRGERVGLEPTADGVWRVHLGPIVLGFFHEANGKLIRADQFHP